ncbi:MAG: tRNA isopentenyl-2-thiomethyl-A-37 hydroxylase MiaE [Pseudomonadota bacterium]
MSDENLASLTSIMKPIIDFLGCPTPKSWILQATENIEILLLDHAHCEKKAAATGLNLIFKYPENEALCYKLSCLVREEMRHFEQVLSFLQQRGYKHRYLSSSRYAENLRSYADNAEPQRGIDILIISAFIEARSCERFYQLIPHLDAELAQFYTRLVKSEARHFEDYLTLAKQISSQSLEERIEYFRQVEQESIQTPDSQFRFHSGMPVQLVC